MTSGTGKEVFLSRRAGILKIRVSISRRVEGRDKGMPAEKPIQWAARISPEQVRRLYRLNAQGLYDDDLIAEVGWGLYARCQDVMLVHDAMRGEVPCPVCGKIVLRETMRGLPSSSLAPSEVSTDCPHCRRPITWRQCREALRNHPRCFDCNILLGWNYEGNRLACRKCQREWTWQSYLRSVKTRVWLPCPHCHNKLRQQKRCELPAPTERPSSPVPCPKCRATAYHSEGKLSCKSCGHQVPWSRFRKLQKRRVERLACISCGHPFTWRSWKKRYSGCDLLTGNPMPVELFIASWPTCMTPQQRMIKIDGLLHAIHGRGALGPNLVEGTQDSVRRLLDELAG